MSDKTMLEMLRSAELGLREAAKEALDRGDYEAVAAILKRLGGARTLIGFEERDAHYAHPADAKP